VFATGDRDRTQGIGRCFAARWPERLEVSRMLAKTSFPARCSHLQVELAFRWRSSMILISKPQHLTEGAWYLQHANLC